MNCQQPTAGLVPQSRSDPLDREGPRVPLHPVDPQDTPSEPRPPRQTVRTQVAIAVAFIAIFAAAAVLFGLQRQWALMALFLVATALNGWMMYRSLLGRRRRP